MWLELRAIMDHLSNDPSTRAVVISGAGPKAFTTGLDVAAAAQAGPLSTSPDSSFSSDTNAAAKLTSKPSDAARIAKAIRRHVSEFQDCISSVERCSKPVITVLHGYCFGLGIDLSSAADIRIATADCRMCVKEVDIGIAADIGTLTRLPKVVGSYSWVKEVCYSARIFGAAEAMRVGFVSKVVEQGGKNAAILEAVELAKLIASKSPVAVQGTKELLDYSRDHTVAEGLRYTYTWASLNLQTNDVVEAMTANIKKRVPTYEKL